MDNIDCLDGKSDVVKFNQIQSQELRQFLDIIGLCSVLGITCGILVPDEHLPVDSFTVKWVQEHVLFVFVDGDIIKSPIVVDAAVQDTPEEVNGFDALWHCGGHEPGWPNNVIWHEEPVIPAEKVQSEYGCVGFTIPG